MVVGKRLDHTIASIAHKDLYSNLWNNFRVNKIVLKHSVMIKVDDEIWESVDPVIRNVWNLASQ